MKFKLLIPFIFLYLLSPKVSFTQDSLWIAWNDTSNSDLDRLLAIHKYGWSFLYSNPDSTFYYAKLERKFAEEREIYHRVSSAINSMAASYYVQGRLDQALESYEEGIEIDLEIGKESGVSKFQHNMAGIYLTKGEYYKAKEYYLLSLVYKEKHDLKGGVASSYVGLGTVYNEQGDNKKALECYEIAREIYQEIASKSGLSMVLNNIGVVYEDLKENDKAIDYYQQGLVLKEEINSTSGMIYGNVNVGRIYQHKKEFTKAIEKFTLGLELAYQIDDKIGVAMSLNNIGDTYLRLGQIDSAINYNRESYSIAVQTGHIKYIQDASLGLYQAYLTATQLDSAEYFLKVLLDTRDKEIKYNFSVLSEREKELFFSGMAEEYEQLYQLALIRSSTNPEITELAYNKALQLKGLLLKSSTAVRNAILNSNDSILIEQYDHWIDLRSEISNKYSQGENTEELEKEADELEKELVKKSNEFSELEKTKKLTWKVVRDNLLKGEVAIEFVQFRKLDFADQNGNGIHYAALIVKHNSEHPEMVELCSEKELQNALGYLQGNNLTYIKELYGTLKHPKKVLYDLVWKPLEKSLKKVQKVYYSPVGLLHKVAFSALANPKGVYLCDSYNLHLKGSTGNIHNHQNHEGLWDKMAIFGGVQYSINDESKEVWSYLPGTLSEAKNIYEILKGGEADVTMYSAGDASEERFKSVAQNNTVLHVATHGFFFPDPEKIDKGFEVVEEVEELEFRGQNKTYALWNFVQNKNPLMRSGLAFSGANDVWTNGSEDGENDGVLTAQEVSNLDLRNTQLVVLSACETGLGDIKGSEGVYGLQRSFKMAGANYLIISLWQVPDKETSEFMQLFYQNLLVSKDIHDAFTQAQSSMSEMYDPYYWAAFVLLD